MRAPSGDALEIERAVIRGSGLSEKEIARLGKALGA